MKKKAVCMLLGVLLTEHCLPDVVKTRQQRLPAKAHRPKRKEPEREQLILQRMNQKKTDETADTKTDKKAEKGTDAEETGEDASETEENREKIAVLLPDEQNWTRDAKELEVQFGRRRI